MATTLQTIRPLVQPARTTEPARPPNCPALAADVNRLERTERECLERIRREQEKLARARERLADRD